MTFKDAKFQKKISATQQRRLARERFLRARKVERSFQRQLTAIAKHVGSIIKTFAPDGIVTDMSALRNVLSKYSEALRPWSYAVAQRMQNEVAQRDEYAWTKLGTELGRNLRAEISKAPTGQLMQSMLNERVELITSLPTKAAERVHKLTLEGIENASRASEIAKEIMRSGQVTVSRAKLIARTEVSSTASTLTESRARFIGSKGYIWRTSKDPDVRDIHKHLEGEFVRWDDPPISGENGERAHAGRIYNCRCYPEPIIPDSVMLQAA